LSDLSAPLRQFVEDMGLRYEEDGLPPMAGRVAGWLLVCDPPHQTAGELAEVLGASAGSVSSMTRLLIQCGLVERVAVPGQRATTYRIRPNVPLEIMRRWLEGQTRKREILEGGLAALADAPPHRRERLEEQHRFHRFLEREVPLLIERFERESSK
jgi:DNA-binding transcriptional regulator GbsR (MarR family)